MALYFHPLYTNFILGPCMYYNTIGAGSVGVGSSWPVSPTSLKAITIYSGTQPSAASFESNFNTTYRNNHLIHITGSTWAPLTANAQTSSITQYYISLLPTATAASASGTASWAILWPDNYSMATLNSGIGASFYAGTDQTYGRYIILPVSDNAGNGMIKLNTTNIVSGTSYSVQSGSFSFSPAPIV